MSQNSTQVAIAMQEVTTGIQLMMNALEARSANSERDGPKQKARWWLASQAPIRSKRPKREFKQVRILKIYHKEPEPFSILSLELKTGIRRLFLLILSMSWAETLKVAMFGVDALERCTTVDYKVGKPFSGFSRPSRRFIHRHVLSCSFYWTWLKGRECWSASLWKPQDQWRTK